MDKEMIWMMMAWIVFGGFMAGFMLYEIIKYFVFFHKAIIVQGTVVSEISWRNTKGVRLYAPVVRYHFDGLTSTVSGQTGTMWHPKKGKIMTVGINPANSSDVRLKQLSGLILQFELMLLGLTWLAIGLYVCFS